MQKIPRYRQCFVCGRDNAAGLDVQFFRLEGKIVCDWVPHEKHLGYRDRIHGGIVATILDEAMSWAPTAAFGRMCYSIELAVKYRQAVPASETLRVEAEVEEQKPRLARTRGRILNAAGEVCAEATGTYFPLRPGKTEELLPYLYIEGDEGRAVGLEDL
jgi:uncharacterized protein (TIGR00369 family)